MPQLATKQRQQRAPRKRARSQTHTNPGKAKPRKTNGRMPKPAVKSERGGGQGGRRLATAFDSASRLPALAESRRRFLRASVREVVVSIDTYDPLDSPSIRTQRYERFRRHAVATRHAADRIGELARLPERDELAVAALVHDIGRLVLSEMYGQFERLDDRRMAPEARVRCERRELGIDHALVGSVLARRWGFPRGVVVAVERHHTPRAGGHAAAIRLADLIVHHAHGEAAPADAIVDAASRLGLERQQLGPLLYEFPYVGTERRRGSEPCPLSVREVDALRGLAEGKVYKQIAAELSLSVSTIRTHLHNVYRKIDAVDRAQAVLIARDRGWI